MNFIKVHNVKVIKDVNNKDYFAKEEMPLCACSTCIEKAITMGNVEEFNEDKGTFRYTVALCESCMSKTESYDVNISDLVIA